MSAMSVEPTSATAWCHHTAGCSLCFGCSCRVVDRTLVKKYHGDIWYQSFYLVRLENHTLGGVDDARAFQQWPHQAKYGYRHKKSLEMGSFYSKKSNAQKFLKKYEQIAFEANCL